MIQHSDPKEAWHYNHVTFTPIAEKFMLYCRLIYLLSMLYVRLTIKVKVGIPESFKVGWYPHKITGSCHLTFAQFFFINDLDLTTNNEYSGKVASFNGMWQGRYTPLNFCYFCRRKEFKKYRQRKISFEDRVVVGRLKDIFY